MLPRGPKLGAVPMVDGLPRAGGRERFVLGQPPDLQSQQRLRPREGAEREVQRVARLRSHCSSRTPVDVPAASASWYWSEESADTIGSAWTTSADVEAAQSSSTTGLKPP
jgi:hypothetical protein